jgi:periplasmic protein TonB
MEEEMTFLRNIFSFPIAGLVTVSLFILMKELVTGGGYEIEEALDVPQIDFVRVKRDEDINVKDRMPARPQQNDPEPPPPPMSNQAQRAPDVGGLGISLPSFDGIDLGDLALGAPSDGDVIPVVRVPPQYPRRALSRGIEGWVLLEFTVTQFGTVEDPRVIRADPESIFDSAALRAVSRWKYKPQTLNGRPTDRQGVQTVLTFEIDQ